VHGSRRKLEKFLKTLGELCLKDPKKIEEFFVVDKAINFRDEVIKYPLSFEKIIRMNQNLIHNGFTSYAEA
jgi:5-methylcytosine-specific restriction protein B